MSLTIKAKLRHTKVIRRLKVSPNFESIQQRLREAFEVPNGEKMRVCWRDADDDLVTLGSESELQDALSNDTKLTKSGVFCVEVMVKNVHDSLGYSSSSSSASEDDSDECAGRNKQLHPGVVCDGCQHSLRGYRFKCIVCPDYDLCLRCETQGRHCQHDMLLIRKPLGSGGCGSGGLSNVLNLLNQFFNVPLHLEVRREFSDAPENRVPFQSPCPAAESQAAPHCASQARNRQEQSVEDSISDANSYPRYSGVPAPEATVPIQRSDQHMDDSNPYPRYSGVPSAQATQNLVDCNPYPRFPATSSTTTETTATNQQGSDQDWNMVDHDEVAAVQPGSAAQVHDNPTLSPIVNQSREQMIAMGFNDENGVLTNLLQQHNGDIGRVLDIIRASY